MRQSLSKSVSQSLNERVTRFVGKQVSQWLSQRASLPVRTLNINLKDRLAGKMKRKRNLFLKIKARDVCSLAGAVWRCWLVSGEICGAWNIQRLRSRGIASVLVLQVCAMLGWWISKQVAWSPVAADSDSSDNVAARRLAVTSLHSGSKNCRATASWGQEPLSLRRALTYLNLSENKTLEAKVTLHSKFRMLPLLSSDFWVNCIWMWLFMCMCRVQAEAFCEMLIPARRNI